MPLEPSDLATPVLSPEDESERPPPCILAFNHSDPIGASGLASDIATICSVGGHPTSVMCGAYLRDSREIHGHVCLSSDALSEQAQNILEDVPVQAIKIGFLGSTENIGAAAEVLSDYSEAPVVAYMPYLGWMESEPLEDYLDAFRELLLPMTSLLIGNYSTLCRWLLPDWEHDYPASVRDLALAAGENGVPYILVSGMPGPDQSLHTHLLSGHNTLFSHEVERFDAQFIGAGDTLSAAMTALLACGKPIEEAAVEALVYLDRCLESGFRPGMGHVIPDRMFWAVPSDDEDPSPAPDANPSGISDPTPIDGFVLPPHDTQH